jgi:hypothetical protein
MLSRSSPQSPKRTKNLVRPLPCILESHVEPSFIASHGDISSYIVLLLEKRTYAAFSVELITLSYLNSATSSSYVTAVEQVWRLVLPLDHWRRIRRNR